MPKLRLLGATKMPLSEEETRRPPTSISPAIGFSSPAIERSVVVLPQPDGPSSVNSLPSGTSNETSCAALTAPPRSLAYSVKSDLTLSTFPSRVFLCFRNSEPPADELCQHDHQEQRDDQHDAERRKLHILPILPQLPYHDRYHFGARGVEQDRARQLPDRDDHHVDPPGQQSRLQQWQNDAAKGHAPGGAAHRRRLLELLVNLQHRGRIVAHAIGQKTRHIGDEHDPKRAVDAD